ncbi:MAG: hypothetical protein A3E78_11205 [Alphaproteobacteria bacterium RIFCSPHIGHO2_12_FULL_63_12]|nr:MAG: hypothetical protein A3E78_11205 [Alphaproteobacteria bacterium RIFCSPHIGHO2_12_FULL_63_12]
MFTRKPETLLRLSRRSALLAGGGVAAAVAGVGAFALRRPTQDISFLKDLDLSGAKPLGDGFYEVDGWVVTADDIRRLGGAAPVDDNK